jgi:2-polyprenyl-3-methyl-5-hydroxy-6-metoxy-1,4-benzoquinol methylase
MTSSSIRDFYAGAWHGEQPYDAKEEVRLSKACERVREHAAGAPASLPYELLDIGCGVGPLRRWLDRERFRITGLEWSEEAAALCRGNYDACRVGSVEEEWPFREAAFDGVHAGAILEHVFDWHAPLNQANRVLRPGGQLVVSVPNLRYWKEIRRLIRGKQPHWMSEMLHIHAYTPKFLRDLVTLHGFAVTALEADRVNLPLLPKNARWVTRRFAGLGSVIILTARLERRTRVEDRSRAPSFAGHRAVGLRSIEIIEAGPVAPPDAATALTGAAPASG